MEAQLLVYSYSVYRSGLAEYGMENEIFWSKLRDSVTNPHRKGLP